MKTMIGLALCAGVLFAMPPKTEWKKLTPVKAGEKVRILVKEKPITYNRLSATSPLEVKVKGKTKLRIYVRCEVPEGATAAVPYAFTSSIDGGAPKKHDASAVPSKVAKYEGTGKAVPGDADSFYVDIPDGEHTVTVAMDPAAKEVINVRFYLPKKKSKKPAEPGK